MLVFFEVLQRRLCEVSGLSFHIISMLNCYRIFFRFKNISIYRLLDLTDS
jgi:hypothetical protein